MRRFDGGPFRLISSINLDMHEILVVGGGLTSLRKIDTLLGCGARVRVVAPEVISELEALASDGRVILERREACEDDFASHRFAVLAVPRDALCGLARMARAAGCAIDACANGAEGDFALCAQFGMDGCFVGVSSGGLDPARAASVKQSILKTFREPISVLTRKSQLATAQAALWTDALETAGFRTSLRTVESHGDRDRRSELSSFGFGAFVKALEDELLNGRGDCAVHSMKDVPTIPVEGCSLAAVLKRGSARDVLVTRDGCGLEALPRGAVVGTSSVRRRAQIRHVRPDLACVNCRGNIGTRLDKLFRGEVDALVLAEVGLERIGAPVRTEVLPFITSAGQGAVVAEALAGSVTERILTLMNHLPTWYEVTAERLFLSRLARGCVCPVGVNASYRTGQMEMTAEVYPELGAPERATVRGAVDSEKDAAALADELWEMMRDGPVVREIIKAIAS
jgi:hydroxymethylbilane synthase